MPKALKSCPTSKKSPDLVTLLAGEDNSTVSRRHLILTTLCKVRTDCTNWWVRKDHRKLVSNGAGLDSNKHENMLLLLCSNTTESKPVKVKANCTVILPPENTTLRGSFSAYIELATYLLVWSNLNQSNRLSAVQWYFPNGKCSLLPPTVSVLWVGRRHFDRNSSEEPFNSKPFSRDYSFQCKSKNCSREEKPYKENSN